MSIPVAVVDPLPPYRAGLVSALAEAGFAPEEPPDLSSWLQQDGCRAVVITVDSPDERGRLAELRAAKADVLLVGLISEPRLDTCLQTLKLGGCSVMSRQAPPQAVVRALEAALERQSVLPLDVAQSLAAAHVDRCELHVNEDELAWLRALAHGTTVCRLAAEAGYSEREMYRRLAGLYRRLQAANRAEALVQAARLGLLED